MGEGVSDKSVAPSNTTIVMRPRRRQLACSIRSPSPGVVRESPHRGGPPPSIPSMELLVDSARAKGPAHPTPPQTRARRPPSDLGPTLEAAHRHPGQRSSAQQQRGKTPRGGRGRPRAATVVRRPLGLSSRRRGPKPPRSRAAGPNSFQGGLLRGRMAPPPPPGVARRGGPPRPSCGPSGNACYASTSVRPSACMCGWMCWGCRESTD